MVWSCNIVPNCLRSISSQKDCSCIFYFFKIFRRVFNCHFKMLWSNLIRKVDCTINIFADDNKSILIPTFFGLLVLLLGVLSLLMPSRRKLLMHLVAILGVLIFLGGLDFIRSALSSGVFSNPWADLSKLMMALTGFIFCFLCIKSFIVARKNL